MPEASKWREIVAKGLKKCGGTGHRPATVLRAESRATPGCVMKRDVVASRHGNGKMRLWQVRRSSAVEVELVRLQKRMKRREAAVKEDRVTVTAGGGAWNARAVESPTTGAVCKVKYADGGVVIPVARKDLFVYGLEDMEWNTGKWFAARNMVADGKVRLLSIRNVCEFLVCGEQ